MKQWVAWAAALILFSSEAAATTGHKVLKSSWTMTDDHFGNVTIDANNVTLDCGGHQIHSSSTASVNCLGSSKCGIAAQGRSGVTVVNCYVVGGALFRHGVWFKNMTQSSISQTIVSNPTSHGFVIDGGGGSSVSSRVQLYFLTATNIKDFQTGYLLNGVNGAIGRGLVVQGNTRGNGMKISGSQNIGLEDITMNLASGINGVGVGLEVSGGSSDVFIGSSAPGMFNLVQEFSSAGVRISNSTRVQLQSFVISNNEGIGLHLKNATSSDLFDVGVSGTEDSCGCDTVIETNSLPVTGSENALGTMCPAVPDPNSCP